MSINQRPANEPIAVAEDATLQNTAYRQDLNGRDRNILSKINSAFALVNGPQEFHRFTSTRYEFRLNIADPLDLQDSINSNRQHTIDYVETFFMALFERIRNTPGINNGPSPRDSDIVHMYLQCRDVDFLFSLDYVGRDAMTLGGLLNRQSGMMDTMMENFANIIQSGNHVVLDSNTRVLVWLFHVPAGGGKYIKTIDKEDFLKRSKCIRQVYVDSPLCMAGAIHAARMDRDVFRKEYLNAKSRQACRDNWTQKARQLCFMADVSPTEECGLPELEKFAQHLQINLHVFNLQHVNFNYGDAEPEERRLHSTRIDGKPHYYLLLLDNHYHVISNPNGFLRSLQNNRRELCDECQIIFKTKAEFDQHECVKCYDKLDTLHPKEVQMFRPTLGTTSNEPKFLKPTKEKKDTIKGLIFLDFETYPALVPRYPDVPLPEEDSMDFEPSCFDPYVPYPFTPREFDESIYKLEQTVNKAVCQYENGETFVFDSLKDTFMWICKPEHENFCVMAHCGGKFDFQLLFSYYLSADVLRQGKPKNPLLKGQKIMSATLAFNIKLLDSYNFISKPLSAMPKIFGLTDSKGDFPHMFNLPEHQNYVGPIPAIEWYDPDSKSVSKREELLKWHAEQVENKVVFDFKSEIEKYCIMDVDILRQCLMAFRVEFQNLQDTHGKFIGCDPFNYLTIASVAFEGIYCRHYMPENKIIVVPRPGNDTCSMKQIAWLEHVQNVERWAEDDDTLLVQHAYNGFRYGAEVVLTMRSGKKVKVDGFCEQSNTVYQFHGCYWHGCPKCYEPTKWCDMRTITVNTPKGLVTKPLQMGSAYANTKETTKMLKDNGYQVVEMWECDWEKNCKALSMDPRGWDVTFKHLEPLVPRDAYFGGRVNCTKLLYHCEGQEKIFYQDVTSMYPAVMCFKPFPIGVPKVFTRTGPNPEDNTFIPINRLFGLMKCTITAPDNLYHGVLPVRDVKSKKVTFPLGTMTGTWTHVEINLALEMGYKIDEIFVQHHFDEVAEPGTPNSLFEKYIQTFFDIKQQAANEGNKGRAELAKLMINSPTGKWGFNPGKQRSTRLVDNHQDFFKYLLGVYTRCSIDIFNEYVALVNVQENDELSTHGKSNVYIAAYITAYSREKLYREALIPCGENVLYFDTDSVIYVSTNGEPIIPIDTTKKLGLWTSEAPEGDHFTDFVSCGPKSYALKTFNGKFIEKSKGFYLHYNNQKIYNFDALEKQVVSRSLGRETEDLVLHKDETIMKRKMFKIEVAKNTGKRMKMPYDKRVIVFPLCATPKVIDTLPHGHAMIEQAKKDRGVGEAILDVGHAYNLPNKVLNNIMSFVF